MGSLHLSSCWTPFFWHSNVRDGALAAAAYSAFLCVFVLAYTAYVMAGGDSSQLWLPFFETNLDSSLVGWGSFALVYFLLFLAASACLVAGVRWDIRGLMLPWMTMMFLVILFQVSSFVKFLSKMYMGNEIFLTKTN